MRSLVICSSAGDASIAATIRRYVEANCRSIELVEDARVQSGKELLETVEHALSADVVLLLLSPDSSPRAWVREEWEPVLVEQPRELDTALAFVLARPCRFPEVFRKQNFIDLSGDWRSGIRKLRRWLLDQNPLKQERTDFLPPRSQAADVSRELLFELERSIVDQPGVVCDVDRSAALAFAHEYSQDFEGTFWLDCTGRSRAGVIGDAAHAVGLKLTGTSAQNSAALCEFCSEPRCLFVFDQLASQDRELVKLRGRASVIFVAGSTERSSVLPLAETVEIFDGWRVDPERCLRHLRDAEQHLQTLKDDRPADTTTVAAKRLAASMFALLRQQERLAEAYEILEVLSKQAWSDGDVVGLRFWESEKGWIRHEWGETDRAPLRLGGMTEPVQTNFEF